ncbi:SitI3 family protein [Actinoplanes sp. NPDC023714]|uniref:SitI3 family protein n=1 Tax=Actinoplanes sp. NPDC023714 TaxID=3154322 RepID=UPI0034088671
MATEYSLSSDADLATGELLAFFAAAIGGRVDDDGEAVIGDGMTIWADLADEDDADVMKRLFGFEERIAATFRFHNLAGPETIEHSTALMVATVLALTERYTGNGVLLYNSEVAVIRWSPDEVVFHEAWDAWTRYAEVTPLLVGHPVRSLPQPLL